MIEENKNVIVIGAGPAGLAVSYYLLKHSEYKPIIIEESEYIGGISRTHVHNGNRMDLGGHRFFTKSKEVMDLWEEIFPIQERPSIDDIILNRLDTFSDKGISPEECDNVFLKRNRLSRIYFMKKFFDYPISFKPKTFFNLGVSNVITAGLGYLKSCICKRKENSLEDFYINRFGKPLYKMFFEDYTEKLWGIHPSQIEPDWGAQRVKGLSLLNVIKNGLFKPFLKKENEETSLIENFLYPKKGPGQFYEALAEKITELGGKIILNQKVIKFDFDNRNICSVYAAGNDGKEIIYKSSAVFSSMPVKDLVAGFQCDIPYEIKEIASNLPYRDFMTVGLLVKKLAIKNKSKYKTVSDIIPDCWIYIQEKDVKLGRLQIFNNWSPYLNKDFKNTVWLGLEYFCDEGDNMWTADDTDFIRTAVKELEQIGIINADDVIDSVLVRVKKAYPAYFGAYKDFNKLRNYLDSINNLYCVGRNGQHRYNNMDHSILTGFEAAKSFLGNNDKTLLWSINTEKGYHESK